MKRNKILAILVFVGLLNRGCEEILEKSLAGQKVVLLAPVNNLITTDTVQTLYWENMVGANRYQLQVVSPKIDSIVKLVADTIITANRFTIILERRSYQWRVKALNNSTSSDFSDEWNFRIQ